MGFQLSCKIDILRGSSILPPRLSIPWLTRIGSILDQLNWQKIIYLTNLHQCLLRNKFLLKENIEQNYWEYLEGVNQSFYKSVVCLQYQPAS